MKKIKTEIVRTLRKMNDLNLIIGSEGNISCKFGKKIFITPSGIETSKLHYNEISELDLSGNILNKKKPSSEVLMHLSIYKNRPNIHCIVHCHSVWASILSCQRIRIPAFHYMVAEFGGRDIKCAKYATFGSSRLAKNVLNVLKDREGCLLANHGQLTVGKSLDIAFHLAIALEKISKQFFFCNLSSQTKYLENSEMDKVLKLFKNYKSRH